MTLSRRVTTACVQVTAGTDMDANLAAAADGIRRAADAGAGLITTPECVSMMIVGRERVLAAARPEGDHPAIGTFAELARETGAAILAGSLSIRRDDGRAANRSYLFGADGAILARYDKIHMFDVDLPGGERYRESSTYAPGAATVIAETPIRGAAGPVETAIGLTICYDLRFPHLFRDLAKAGAQVITVPSAFAVPTGRAHWEVLLRARAIETGCFVVAAAQTGTHDRGRQTWGHSLVVAPWGEVLADGGTAPGVVTATVDLDRVDAARAAVPALGHDRPYAAPVRVATRARKAAE
ncbi:MAG: carbon-nitrogen hydrolase family protein [Alphaproteobacteria bacterium]|jgi:predicted amidohydrolase|nr:carbon-nitrogen hydrolase family protein [Alphaproteobacteria bacterium]